jgi:cytochrome c oxidase subunit 2
MISNNRVRLLRCIALFWCLWLACSFQPILAQDTPDAAPAAAEDGQQPQKKLIKMFAENWNWHPNVIRVAQGTHLTIIVENVDSPHVFLLKPYKLKVRLSEDEKTTIEFVADKVGTFTWRCGRPCGNGCPKMTGKLIVE